MNALLSYCKIGFQQVRPAVGIKDEIVNIRRGLPGGDMQCLDRGMRVDRLIRLSDRLEPIA